MFESIEIIARFGIAAFALAAVLAVSAAPQAQPATL